MPHWPFGEPQQSASFRHARSCILHGPLVAHDPQSFIVFMSMSWQTPVPSHALMLVPVDMVPVIIIPDIVPIVIVPPADIVVVGAPPIPPAPPPPIPPAPEEPASLPEEPALPALECVGELHAVS